MDLFGSSDQAAKSMHHAPDTVFSPPVMVPLPVSVASRVPAKTIGSSDRPAKMKSSLSLMRRENQIPSTTIISP